MTETRGSTALPERDRGPSGRRRPGFFGWLASRPAAMALFYRQVVAELRKVVWPTRPQLLTYTTVVIVFVLFMIAIVSVLDLVFGWAMFKVFG